MTRAAVTVFIETDHEGDVVDAAELFRQALRRNTANLLTVTLNGREYSVEVIECMEAGSALRNGYLQTQLTPKAWQERGR